MRTFSYYSTQIILIALSGYLAYLPTLKIDLFSWGNSKNNGLYLLIVPMILLPLIIGFSIVKYLIVRKADISFLFKNSFILTILVALLDTLILLASGSSGGLVAVTVISISLTFFLLIETLLFKRLI